MLQFPVIFPETGVILQIPGPPEFGRAITIAWLQDVILVSSMLRRVSPNLLIGVIVAAPRSSREKKG